MFLQRVWRWLDRSRTNSWDRSGPRCRARLMVELLEERTVPASYTAATAPELIGAITAANQSAEADTITLTPGATFTLKQAYGLSHFAMTGLPPSAAKRRAISLPIPLAEPVMIAILPSKRAILISSILLQIVEHDFAEAEREVGYIVRPRHHLAHGQAGDVAHGVLE